MEKKLVVGRGMVAQCFAASDDAVLTSHRTWQVRTNFHTNAIVCTAGIVGKRRCDNARWSSIWESNVGLPLQLQKAAAAEMGIPFIVFSSSSIYRSNRDGRNTETSDVHPHNRYCASKIAMENALLRAATEFFNQFGDDSRTYILRIPQLVLFEESPWNFSKKIEEWDSIDECTIPVIYPDTISKAVDRIVGRKDICAGIYNLASEEVYLPDFIESHFPRWIGKTTPAGVGEECVRMSPLMALEKSQMAGLIEGFEYA